MTTLVKTAAIDADAHVVETEDTWEYMDPSEQKYKPVLLQTPNDAKRQYWLIDGKVRGLRLPAFSVDDLEKMSQAEGRSLATAREAREMGNVGIRLQHMDRIGADIQVLHNTLFIQQVTDRAAVEVALYRSWNRWLADIWRKGEGRLRWSCMAPCLSIEDARDQMRYGKEHGACAVIMRPVEGNRLMHDEYFYPIYEEASRLDLPIAVHIANGNLWLDELYRHPVPSASGFARFRIPTVTAMHDLIMSDVLQDFPKLRVGFIEASAQWVPWVLHEAQKRFRILQRPWPENPMKEFRLFVTCENSDDVSYIIEQAGVDGLIIGTDYGHTDPSSDLDAIRTFQGREDLSAEVKQKILTDNPRAFYAL